MGEIATPSRHRLKNQQSTRRTKHGKDDSSNSVAGYYPEGGWGYVVVVAAFFALMTQMGIIVSMGVYLEHIEKEFHAGAGIGGWISSGCFAVLALSCEFSSFIQSFIQTTSQKFLPFFSRRLFLHL